MGRAAMPPSYTTNRVGNGGCRGRAGTRGAPHHGHYITARPTLGPSSRRSRQA